MKSLPALRTWRAAHARGHRGSAKLPRRAALLSALLALTLTGRLHAHKNGSTTEGCAGCHRGGQTPTVSITPDLQTFDPGQTINLTISVSQTNGPVAGFYLEAKGGGTFEIVDSGTKLGGNGVTHSSPRTGSGGFTTFKVGWTAPPTAGGVDFYVWANSANGDGTQQGDGEGDGFFSTAFGCAGTRYFHDYDGDGVGALASGYTVACSAPANYSALAGDCNDNDTAIHPGASEICDGKDNDCNGQVDEGLAVTAYCTDADGDGHGVTGKATTMSCGTSKGFGLCDNDCNDADATIYPGAPESCNLRDDNCNGQIDEGARAVCGVGWCAAYAAGCDDAALDCTPGAPRAEECNDFDDDCDGVKDNGTDLELCKTPGLACRNGYCVPSDAPSNGGSSGSSGATLLPTAGSAGISKPAPGSAGCSITSANQAPRATYAALVMLLALTASKRRKRRTP